MAGISTGDLLELLEHIAPFLIGAAGALVTAVRFATPGSRWSARAFNVLTGSLVAGFGSPALVLWLQFGSPVYERGCAFVVGLLGMSIVDALMQAARETKLSDVAGWLTKRR